MKKIISTIFLMIHVGVWANSFSVDKRVTELLSASAQKNYNEFIKTGSEEFKKLDKKEFDRVSDELSLKMKAGIQLTSLTTLKQGDFLVHLFKLSFKGRNEDALVRIILGKNNETLGFWIQ